MKRFAALHVIKGGVRNLTLEAVDFDEAKEIAEKWGVGIVGEADYQPPPQVPEAYDMENTCRLLGGVSRKTIYRLIVTGRLSRVPDTRRVLVTRRSLEALAAGRR